MLTIDFSKGSRPPSLGQSSEFVNLSRLRFPVALTMVFGWSYISFLDYFLIYNTLFEPMFVRSLGVEGTLFFVCNGDHLTLIFFCLVILFLT